MTTTVERFTRIKWNGSKFAGQEPDPIEKLLDVLGRFQLDPRFGQFYQFNGDGSAKFFGNFSRLSHAFGIDTNDPEVIGRLVEAIDANAKLPADDVSVFYQMRVGTRVYERDRTHGDFTRWYRRIPSSGSVARTDPGDSIAMEDMQRMANEGIARIM